MLTKANPSSTFDCAPEAASFDRLSSLLERFRMRAKLFYSGTMCGRYAFDSSHRTGYLHVLRQGHLEVRHPVVNGESKGVPKRLLLDQPSVLFYPRPFVHHFHNPPVEGSQFTCAQVEFEHLSYHPIAQALPALVVLPLDEIDGLQASLELLFAETATVRCGQRLLVDRLFEVVVVQLLRWMLDHPQRIQVNTGLLYGLSSPTLARALVALHQAPQKQWTLERLAQIAGMSRTAFAVEFKKHLGQTPGEYLADWRLALAQNRLREGASLKTLAGELGYASQSALSRVFTARVGQSPRQWLAEQT